MRATHMRLSRCSGHPKALHTPHTARARSINAYFLITPILPMFFTSSIKRVWTKKYISIYFLVPGRRMIKPETRFHFSFHTFVIVVSNTWGYLPSSPLLFVLQPMKLFLFASSKDTFINFFFFPFTSSNNLISSVG